MKTAKCKAFYSMMIMLALAFIALSIPLMEETDAAVTFEVDGITYSVVSEPEQDANGKVNIIGSTDQSGTINIDTITNEGATYDVVEIASNSFENSGLTAVHFGPQLQRINADAFNNCQSLSSVTFEEGSALKYVSGFANCALLKTIILPDTVETIGQAAFKNSQVESITIPNTVKVIGTEAFMGAALKQVSIPGALTTFYGDLFTDCKQLTEVTFGEGYNLINIPKFQGCIELSQFQIPSSVTTISSGVFEGSGLVSINIPAQVTVIGATAFKDCLNLKTVVFEEGSQLEILTGFPGCTALLPFAVPSSVSTIGSNAFTGCTFTSFQVPAGVKEIKQDAFKDCALLKQVEIDENSQMTYMSGFSGCASLKSVDIPDTVETFGRDAFRDTALESIIMPSALKQIGPSAFMNTMLTEVNIPNLETVWVNEFDGCSKLKTVTFADSYSADEIPSFAGCPIETITLPDGITKLQGGTFKGAALTTITIPASVKTIGTDAFRDCLSLTTVNFAEGSQLELLGGFRGCLNLQMFDIPETVTTIDSYCFAETLFEQFTVPKNITKIAQSAFSSCPNLSTLVFDEDSELTYISGFDNCPKLNHVILPDTVNTIGGSAFAYSGLQSIQIPNTVTTMGSDCFRGSALTEITIPGSLTLFYGGMFYDCTLLTEVTFGDGYNLDNMPGFNGCTSLTSIQFPTSVTTINDTQFQNCGFKEITIPATITTIGSDAFSGCALETITSESAASIATTSFSNQVYDDKAWSGWTPEMGSSLEAGVTYTALTEALYSVTYDVNGGSEPAPTQDSLKDGEVFQVAAYAGTKAGFEFGGWSDGTQIYAAGSEYTIAAANVAFTAVWNALEFQITIGDIENGSVQASTEAAVVGTEIELTVTPAAGYRLATLTVTGDDESEIVVSDDHKFTMPAQNVTVSATFEEDVPVEKKTAYVDGNEGDDHFASLDAAIKLMDTYNRFEVSIPSTVGKITITDESTVFVFAKNTKVTASFSYDGATLKLKNAMSKSTDLTVAFGSIHLGGTYDAGEVELSGNIELANDLIIGPDAKLTIADGTSITVPDGVQLIIANGATVNLGEGVTFTGEVVDHSGNIESGDVTLVAIHNAAPAYIQLLDEDGYVVAGNIKGTFVFTGYIEEGKNVTVKYAQTLPADIKIQYKAYAQIKVVDDDVDTSITADDTEVEVTEEIWFYADFENYNSEDSSTGLIYEADLATHYFTVYHKYAASKESSIVFVPFNEDFIETHKPFYHYTILKVNDDGTVDTTDKIADNVKNQMSRSVETIEIEDALEPGTYLLTMIADDGTFGFVNYRFVVNTPDYRIGLTFDSETYADNYSAWIVDINDGLVPAGEISVDGYYVKQITLLDNATEVTVIKFQEGVYTGTVTAGTDSKPVTSGALTLSSGADKMLFTALIPSFTYTENGVSKTVTGNIAYAIAYGEDAVATGETPVTDPAAKKDVYISTGATDSFDFEEMELTKSQAISVIRASNVALTDADVKDLTITVYYLSIADDGMSTIMKDVTISLDLTQTEYYDKIFFGIDDILYGNDDLGITADEHAKWVLMYEITTPANQALNVYDKV